MTKGLHKNSLRKGEPNKWIIEDIIEKIRAEVNRLKKEGENGDALAQANNDYESHLQWEQQIAVANGLLSKLSILTKKEKSNSKDFPTTDEEMAKFLATHPKVELPEKYKTPDWMFEKSEKSVPADLEEAGVEYSKKVSDGHNYRDLRVGFIAGAKWQKEHDAELIEIAYNDGITIGMTKQKEQMMKEAVEGHILGEIRNQEDEPYEIYAESDFLPLNGKFKMGDKVKLIIVKED